jgi:hypothetical protein
VSRPLTYTTSWRIVSLGERQLDVPFAIKQASQPLTPDKLSAWTPLSHSSTSDNGYYVAHGLALRNKIYIWCGVKKSTGAHKARMATSKRYELCKSACGWHGRARVARDRPRCWKRMTEKGRSPELRPQQCNSLACEYSRKSQGHFTHLLFAVYSCA